MGTDSLVVAHRLQTVRASVVVVHGLSCPLACGILPFQGLKLLSPALAGGFSITEPPETPTIDYYSAIKKG